MAKIKSFSDLQFVTSRGSNAAAQMGDYTLNYLFNAAAKKGNRYSGDGSGLTFRTAPHPDIFTTAIKWRAYQAMRHAVRDEINDYNNKKLYQAIAGEKSVFGQNKKNLSQLIVKTQLADMETFNELGVFLKYMGKVANEALVMWIPSDTQHTLTFKTYADKLKNLSHGYTSNSSSEFFNVDDPISELSDTVKVAADPVFIDLGAMVEFSSENNIVLTKVQGRDCSRKEFISGGDMRFSVQGCIFSNYPDVYPYSEVSKLRKIFQHKGTVKVANIMFDQYNVTEIVITDFRMSQQEGFKNKQPYSFSCVAIEPDKVEDTVKDTISVANAVIQEEKGTGWTDALQKVTSLSADLANDTVNYLLDSTIAKI